MLRGFAVLLIACSSGSCALPRPAAIAAASSDWTKVTALRADTGIEAHLSDGRQVTGALTAVNSDEIVLDYTSVLRRDLVVALWIVRGDNQKTAVLAGAAIGLILGTASESTGNDAVIVPAFLAVLGSTIGVRVGKRSPKRQLVYTRPL
jgi:hypothetical protein